MRNPLDRLKFLPWRSLAQVAALTTLIVVVLDVLLSLGFSQSSILASLLMVLLRPPLGILTILFAAIGVGALAVYIFEQVNGPAINTSSLWALTLCLAIALFLKQIFPLPAILTQIDQVQLVGVVVGVFWKGGRYWR